MTTEQPAAEDLLRETLREKAREAHDTLTFEDVRRAATASRRHSSRRVVALAAAAVAAVAAPAGVFALTHRDASAPPPPAHTTSDSPSPTPTTAPSSTPQARLRLASIPRGADPGVGYLFGTTIHLASGGTAALPGPPAVSAIAAYHGGWLVGDGVMGGVRWYDNTGALQQEGYGSDRLVVSADATRIAYQTGGEIHLGIASGMGEGEQTVPVSDPVGWPAGFLSDGALVYTDGATVKTDRPEQNAVPAAMVEATTVSVDDVVAGLDDQRRGMLWSMRTGRMLWRGSDWVVSGFSADGKHAAATRNSDDGTSAVAILDTATGRVVAQRSFGAKDLVGADGAIIDTDGSLLVSVSDMGENRTVLRLTVAGRLTRATDILPNDLQRDPENIVFLTGG